MKTFAFSIVFLSISILSFAQEKILMQVDAVKVSQTSVPTVVVQKTKTDFPNGSLVQYYAVGEKSLVSDWKITESDNYSKGDKLDHYVVDMKGKDNHYHALYDASGTLIYSREMEKDVALPATITKAIAKAYPGVALKKDEHSKITDHRKNNEYYSVTLSNGKKVTLKPDGTFIKK